MSHHFLSHFLLFFFLLISHLTITISKKKNLTLQLHFLQQISLTFTFFTSHFICYKIFLLFLPFNPYFVHIKKRILSLSLSHSHSFGLILFFDILEVRIWIYIRRQSTWLYIWMCLSIVNLWWDLIIMVIFLREWKFWIIIWNLKKFNCTKETRKT